jgi:gliding-associated putative ABC transporter substrate-binding component GldG
MGLSKHLNFQYDLTKDRRYSLSEMSISKIQSLEEPLRIDVFLAGKLPKIYIHFRNELDALLNRIESQSDNIIINYNDPFELGENDQIVQEMQAYGMTAEIVLENTSGNRKESLVFPWIIVNKADRSERIHLLSKQLGDSENEKITRSLQQLEYQIMDGIHKVSLQSKPNLAVLTSHGTSDDLKLADLLQGLSPYYNLATFDLRKKEVSASTALENLKQFDALFVSNPKKIFTNQEKYILDQHLQSGGGQLWLVNGVSVNRDSLFTKAGISYGFPLELNLDDYFFNYGIRIQKELIKDLYCAPIVLASGEQNNTQYLPYPWPYYPLSKPEISNTIGKDVGTILSQFVSPIDTLASSMTKIPLVYTSDFSKSLGVPVKINLEEASQKIKPSEYNESSKIIGVLSQGTNKSLFTNRMKPFKINKPIEEGMAKLILFGDGNMAENQTDKGIPLSLGYDKWTSNFYSNKSLIMNSLHYLTGNEERLSLREKTWDIAFLDEQKLNQKSIFWKGILLIIPILLIICIGGMSQWRRSQHLKI